MIGQQKRTALSGFRVSERLCRIELSRGLPEDNENCEMEEMGRKCIGRNPLEGSRRIRIALRLFPAPISRR